MALLSSTATQCSLKGSQVQSKIERSLFIHFLVERLKTGEAAAGAELVTEKVLFQYAYDKVRAAEAGMTPQRWVGRQRGRLVIERWVGRQRGRLVIARNPAWRLIATIGLPKSPFAVLHDPESYIREGAVRELAACRT